MTFISYAQNYEDVILHRALKDVDKGFYIDVGANDPVIESVTKAFYEAGWRGINIEPVSEWFDKLQHDRPEDINLRLAIGARKGEINFYEVVGTGLSTLDKSIARRAQEQGFELKKYKIPVVRLTTICEQYPQKDIHFIKIDVEGTELSVLQGMNLNKFRPWIIVAESTLPNSQIPNFEKWESLLLERDYHYIYFDGLNRYYVADEHAELDEAFITPPNYFDDFKRATEDRLEKHAQWLQNEWTAAKTIIDELQNERNAANTKIGELQNERNAAHTKIDELLNERNAANTRIDELLNERNAANTRIDELLNERNAANARIGELLNKRDAAHTKIDELLNKWDAANTRIDELLNERNAANTRIDELLNERNAANTKIDELLNERSAANTRIDELLNERNAANTRIDELLNERNAANTRIDELLNERNAANTKIAELQNEWDAAKTKIDELSNASHHWWTIADKVTNELHSVYTSRSLRITAPLRWLANQARLLRQHGFFVRFKALLKKIARPIIRRAIAFVSSRPGLRLRLLVLIRSLGLYGVLRSIYSRFSRSYQTNTPFNAQSCDAVPAILQDLPPRARRIHSELKAAIDQRQKKGN